MWRNCYSQHGTYIIGRDYISCDHAIPYTTTLLSMLLVQIFWLRKITADGSCPFNEASANGTGNLLPLEISIIQLHLILVLLYLNLIASLIISFKKIHQLQKRSEGNNDQTEIGDIFQVVEYDDNEEEGNTDNDKFASMEVNEIERNHEEPGRSTEKGGKKDKERVDDDLDCVEIKEGSSEETNADKTAVNSGKKSN